MAPELGQSPKVRNGKRKYSDNCIKDCWFLQFLDMRYCVTWKERTLKRIMRECAYKPVVEVPPPFLPIQQWCMFAYCSELPVSTRALPSTTLSFLHPFFSCTIWECHFWDCRLQFNWGLECHQPRFFKRHCTVSGECVCWTEQTCNKYQKENLAKTVKICSVLYEILQFLTSWPTGNLSKRPHSVE